LVSLNYVSKSRLGSFLPLTFPQANARASAILINKFDASDLKRFPQGGDSRCVRRHNAGRRF
jgi:hypothetical protein